MSAPAAAAGALVPVGSIVRDVVGAAEMAACLRGWAAYEICDARPLLRDAGFSDEQIAATLPAAREMVARRRS